MKPLNRIVIMGVSGAGKTTVGCLLAKKLGGLFVDGDVLHPQINIDKMKQGIALTDADRWPWLDMVAQVIREHDGKRPLIVACSALKNSYRERLGGDFHLVYLQGTSNQIAQQVQNRNDHFMPRILLKSQFTALEEPVNALVLSLDRSPHEIVEEIVEKIVFKLS